MQKTSILFILLVIFIKSYPQILETDVINEVTGDRTRHTSWETLQNDFRFVVFFRITAVNDIHFFEMKLIIGSGKAFSIDRGQELVFTFNNNSAIVLNNIEKAVTHVGGGSKAGRWYRSTKGLKVRYALSPGHMEALRQNKLKTCRIYTDNGFIEPQKIMKKYHLIVRALEVMEVGE